MANEEGVAPEPKPWRLDGYPLTTRLQNMLRYMGGNGAEPGLTFEVESLANSVQSLEALALSADSHATTDEHLKRQAQFIASQAEYDPTIPLDTTYDGAPPAPLGRRTAQLDQGMSTGTKIIWGIGVAILLGIGYWFGYNASIVVPTETWSYDNWHSETGRLELTAIDCGFFGGFVGEERSRVQGFSCRDASGGPNIPEWTNPVLVSIGSRRTCRRELSGEGYCDGTGRPYANTTQELWNPEG